MTIYMTREQYLAKSAEERGCNVSGGKNIATLRRYVPEAGTVYCPVIFVKPAGQPGGGDPEEDQSVPGMAHEPAYNAFVTLDNFGRYTIHTLEGHSMVMCPHCGNHRRVDGFKGDDELQAWFRDCVSNPMNASGNVR